LGELSISHFKRDHQYDEAFMIYQSTISAVVNLGFMATERFNQISIAVTSDNILNKKKEGD